jgi:hypothetical protein
MLQNMSVFTGFFLYSRQLSIREKLGIKQMMNKSILVEFKFKQNQEAGNRLCQVIYSMSHSKRYSIYTLWSSTRYKLSR